MIFPLDIWEYLIIPLLDPRDDIVSLGKTCKSIHRLVLRYDQYRRKHWGYLQRDIPLLREIKEPGTYRIREDLIIPMITNIGILVMADDVTIDGLDHGFVFALEDPYTGDCINGCLPENIRMKSLGVVIKGSNCQITMLTVTGHREICKVRWVIDYNSGQRMGECVHLLPINLTNDEVHRIVMGDKEELARIPRCSRN